MPSILNNVTANYFELVISIKHKQETTIWFFRSNITIGSQMRHGQWK